MESAAFSHGNTARSVVIYLSQSAFDTERPHLRCWRERYVRSVFHTNRQASRVTAACCSCAAVGYIRKLNLRMSLSDGILFPFLPCAGAFILRLKPWAFPRYYFCNQGNSNNAAHTSARCSIYIHPTCNVVGSITDISIE